MPTTATSAAARASLSAADTGVQITRYGGADRYATSLRVAEAVAAEAGGSLDHVVLVSGERWTDAVVAAPVAGALGAPVLMTPPGELRADALAFLQRTGVSNALVIGPDGGGGRHGPGRGVSAGVLTALGEAGISTQRTADSDRYSTGVAAAGRVSPGVMQGLGRTAVVASGEVFADALVAGPFAARGSHPVLLTPPDELHADVAGYLTGAGVAHVVLMGGTAALSDAVATSITGLGISVTRVAGTTRYDTAVKAAELVLDRYSAAAGMPCFATGTVGVARARVPFDSFSAAPLLARLCAPLVLADPSQIPDDTAGFLDAARDANPAVDLRVFGGDAAVSQAAIDGYLAGQDPADAGADDEAPGTPSEYAALEGPRSDQVRLAVSRGQTCMVRPDATVTCWGDGGLRNRLTTAGLTGVTALGAADNTTTAELHQCAVHADGTVSCWGNGGDGKLGQGSEGNHYVPVDVPRISDAVSVAASLRTTCVVHRDGGVSCWGSDRGAEVGGVNLATVFTPTRVKGIENAVAVSAGRQVICAVHGDGGVSCWGVVSPTPGTWTVRIGGLPPVTSVSVGLDQACAVSTAGEVFCWQHKQVDRVAKVEGLHDVETVSVGHDSSCAVHRDGGVSCWGDNSDGQLGDGTTTAHPTPRRVAGITDAIEVGISFGSAGIGVHACVLHRAGGASCWGDNSVGQLGDGTTTARLAPRRAQQFAPIPADEVPINSLEVLHAWIDEVAKQWQDDYPWLKTAWEHIRPQAQVTASGFGGVVWRTCDRWRSSGGCKVTGMNITQLSLGIVVHELLHVYDFHSGLAPPKAWGAVQLYFADKYAGCFRGSPPGAELLADTVKHLMLPHAWLVYYRSDPGCSQRADEPPTVDEQVVLDGLAGKVPQWYTENIKDGGDFWAIWHRTPSLHILANLAPQFGGLCSDDWVSNPLTPDRFPPADSNPFRDGGC